MTDADVRSADADVRFTKMSHRRMSDIPFIDADVRLTDACQIDRRKRTDCPMRCQPMVCRTSVTADVSEVTDPEIKYRNHIPGTGLEMRSLVLDFAARCR
eukprot:3802474-Rhodomonas_salina.2